MASLEIGDNISLHYEVAGKGRPLVFIHGWAMSGRVWRFQAEAFSIDHCVVTLDLRGHGHSSPLPGGEVEVEALAADVCTLVERLDLHDAVLVGWSLGAQVALAATRRLWERLAGLVLIGGTPKFTAGAGYPHGLPETEARGMALRLKRNYAKTMGEFFHGMFAAGELSSDQYQRIVHDIIMGGRLPEPEEALRSLAILAAADLRPLLATIDLPVLLLHGSADTICLPAASRFMAERLPRARFIEMPDLGHAPFLSRPAAFERILREFLTDIHGCH
ncbi:MAG TPA: alpha/beta fold hydrolase [Geobacteraceae bacterium]